MTKQAIYHAPRAAGAGARGPPTNSSTIGKSSPAAAQWQHTKSPRGVRIVCLGHTKAPVHLSLPEYRLILMRVRSAVGDVNSSSATTAGATQQQCHTPQRMRIVMGVWNIELMLIYSHNLSMVILYSYAKKAHGYLIDFQASVFSFITATAVIFPHPFNRRLGR